MQESSYTNSIFINCPFDAAYRPILHAIVFTIYRCGFNPQCVLGEDDATDNRLDKIIRYIRNSQYSIHDLSRVEPNDHGLPRFNMPFELGLFFGAKHFGKAEQKTKNAIIFEREKYTYLEFITDLRGVDVKAHYDNPTWVMGKIRNWLKTASNRATIPGLILLLHEYEEFLQTLPHIIDKTGLHAEDLLFNDFCLVVEEAVKEKIKNNEGMPYPESNMEADVVNDVVSPYFYGHEYS